MRWGPSGTDGSRRGHTHPPRDTSAAAAHHHRCKVPHQGTARPWSSVLTNHTDPTPPHRDLPAPRYRRLLREPVLPKPGGMEEMLSSEGELLLSQLKIFWNITLCLRKGHQKPKGHSNFRVITNHCCSCPQGRLSQIFKAICSNRMALKGKLTTHWTMSPPLLHTGKSFSMMQSVFMFSILRQRCCRSEKRQKRSGNAKFFP